MKGKPSIKIQVTKETASGSYSNLMRATHTKDEFVLDFFHIIPPEGRLTSRIITSPSHMKRIVEALSENLRHYEDQFGVIATNGERGETVIVDPTIQ